MGFSHSGSLLIIFVGLFIAVGSVYTASSNTIDRTSGAVGDQLDQHDAVEGTALTVTNATTEASTLSVTARNTGTTELSLAETDLLVDGVYVEGWQDGATVDDEATELWLPEEQLELTVDIETLDSVDDPQRVKLVTAVGIADSAEVTA